MAASPQPLRTWHTVVPPAWIDYNGHLNEGYYGVAFGDASDALLDHLGFDGEYRENHGTFYTVETRIRFLREVHEGSGSTQRPCCWVPTRSACTSTTTCSSVIPRIRWPHRRR